MGRTVVNVQPLPRMERIKTHIEHMVDTRSARFGAWLLRRTKGQVVRLWHRQALVLTTRGRRSGVVTVIDRLAWDFDDSELVRSRGYAFGDSERLMHPPSSSGQSPRLAGGGARARSSFDPGRLAARLSVRGVRDAVAASPAGPDRSHERRRTSMPSSLTSTPAP
jgi:hypothetical protein